MKNGLKKCSQVCLENKKVCKQAECRLFINYPQEFNCCLISIYENGAMTLREIGDRIGVSFARIKQIETKALQKMKKNNLLM
jgi:hypothetical protein